MSNVVKFQPFPSTKTPFNSLFDEFFNRNIGSVLGHDGYTFMPAVNILDTKDAYKLEVAVPGFDKQDFSVHVEDFKLVISGKHESKQEETDKKYTRREFQMASFKRVFNLPNTVNQDAVAAVYNNGILEVTPPKKEEAKPLSKTIQIA